MSQTSLMLMLIQIYMLCYMKKDKFENLNYHVEMKFCLM